MSSKHKPAMGRVSIQVRGTSVNSKVCVRNLGALTDDKLSMERHGKHISRSAYFHLRCIGNIRRYLTADAAKFLPILMIL